MAFLLEIVMLFLDFYHLSLLMIYFVGYRRKDKRLEKISVLRMLIYGISSTVMGNRHVKISLITEKSKQLFK